ncbi:tumor necrosis factor receptor superfamily member 10A-like isoform X2 [Sciurus carolinensis]|uniref:tumor necrosis factor receptor superfamily member 10A-like isoform X2 n=1 Tax=Sciurus carolinensis TaxID=30640 RepID=UPI001FB287DA|nr:tumor necrosis factor receptor superfamily member 10A-like isoform X2 [Sciurus carolinensis]
MQPRWSAPGGPGVRGGRDPGPSPAQAASPKPSIKPLVLVWMLLLVQVGPATSSRAFAPATLRRMELVLFEESCQAGYYRAPETGACRECREGADFTNHSNNLSSCFPCSSCKDDKEEKSPCTTTRDTVCQCKPGTFQDPESPEYCLRCTRGCTNGLVEESPCVPWSDRKCVHKESAYAVYIVIGVVLAVAVALVILWKFAVLRRLCARAKNILRCGRHCERLNLVAQHPPGGPEAQDNDHNENLSNRNSSSTLEQHLEQQRDRQNLGTVVAEEFPGEVTSLLRPAETEPSRRTRRLTPADGTDTRETLLQFFNCQQNVIPYQSWNKLMRQLGLTNNEIQVIKRETEDPGDVLYQMMVKWFNKMGRDATINSLLDALEILGERTAREKIEEYMVRSGKFIYQEDGADTAESFL